MFEQAPEMLHNEECSEKVDIYSYGIILWELCYRKDAQAQQITPRQVPADPQSPSSDGSLPALMPCFGPPPQQSSVGPTTTLARS